MEAVLEAAERLLAARPPDAISLAEICGDAGVTTGAFYARFRDREALFRVLEERVYARFDELADALDSPEPAVTDLRETLSRIASSTEEIYRRHRGTLRALALLALTDRERSERMAAFNKRLLGRTVERILRHETEITASDAPAAARDAVVWVVTILRQQVLFGEFAAHGMPPDTGRLVALAMSYLTCPTGGAP